MAHEVTRDVTAWASFIGLRRQNILASNRFSRQPAPGPGPASAPSAWISRGLPFHTDGMIATVSATIAHPMGWHGGFPTGRPWVFAIPSPFLGSAPLGIPLPEHSRLFRLDLTIDGRLSLRGGQITCGDSNPDCLASAFLRRSSRVA
jgi:hypothetical protein